jgi:magnesium chelatase family protein
MLDRAVERLGLSARGHAKVLKVACTLAALDARDAPSADDIAEALGLRALDRRAQERPALPKTSPHST